MGRAEISKALGQMDRMLTQMDQLGARTIRARCLEIAAGKVGHSSEVVGVAKEFEAYILGSPVPTAYERKRRTRPASRRVK